MNHANDRPHGFTLIELMITIAVMAILLAFAVPGLSLLVYQTQLVGVVNELNVQIVTARTEAATRGRNSYVCGTSDGFSCDGEWGDGLMSWVDLNGDAEPQDNEIRRFYPINSKTIALDAAVDALEFSPRGQRLTANPNFRIIHEQCSDDNNLSRLASVGATGRFVVNFLSCDGTQVEVNNQ